MISECMSVTLHHFNSLTGVVFRKPYDAKHATVTTANTTSLATSLRCHSTPGIVNCDGMQMQPCHLVHACLCMTRNQLQLQLKFASVPACLCDTTLSLWSSRKYVSAHNKHKPSWRAYCTASATLAPRAARHQSLAYQTLKTWLQISLWLQLASHLNPAHAPYRRYPSTTMPMPASSAPAPAPPPAATRRRQPLLSNSKASATSSELLAHGAGWALQVTARPMPSHCQVSSTASRQGHRLSHPPLDQGDASLRFVDTTLSHIAASRHALIHTHPHTHTYTRVAPCFVQATWTVASSAHNMSRHAPAAAETPEVNSIAMPFPMLCCLPWCLTHLLCSPRDLTGANTLQGETKATSATSVACN